MAIIDGQLVVEADDAPPLPSAGPRDAMTLLGLALRQRSVPAE
ncbi:hypothetical protein [Kitasatospora cinereorecta]|uniref:Uncharacterized protein n=1 Tax=Kitasatospora cinereorecta TaxID=285560 RepID=A0ABW0VAG1_9ACTN